MPNLVQGPVSRTNNHASDLTNSEKAKTTSNQVLERLASTNLKALEAYIVHHPADEEAKALRLSSTFILSKMKSDSDKPELYVATRGTSLQVPDTRDIPFEPLKVLGSIISIEEYFHHICAMECYRNFSPEELHLKDYHQGWDRCSALSLHSLHGASTAATGLQVPNTFGIIFAPSKVGYHTAVEEYFHHICAMDRYRNFSPEELRLNDYHREPAGAPFGRVSTDVPGSEHPENLNQASDTKEILTTTDTAAAGLPAVSTAPTSIKIGWLLTILLLGFLLGLAVDFHLNQLQSLFCTKALRSK
ncbi:MAG: hypothetical protein Q9221_007380 [Calogaya cf. arnoldii]